MEEVKTTVNLQQVLEENTNKLTSIQFVRRNGNIKYEKSCYITDVDGDTQTMTVIRVEGDGGREIIKGKYYVKFDSIIELKNNTIHIREKNSKWVEIK